MRRLILPLFFGILGTTVLMSLGFWQVQRLTWKQDVLAQIDARIVAAPIELPQNSDPERDRYLPVRMSGLITDQELHVLASIKKVGPGYRVISAFQTDTGRRVLLDRGFIHTARKNDPRPPVHAMVQGNLHWPEETDGYTPENDIDGNIWFARDVAVMAAALGTEPLMVIARTSAESQPDGTVAGHPAVTPLPVDSAGIPNDHLQYAVTWFGLAAVWVLMTLHYLRLMRKKKEA